VFHGRLLDVYLDRIALPGGTSSTREIVAHPGAAAAIPLASPDGVLLVRQYRHAVRSDLWEIPAGKLEPGEDPLSCAKRELREETGRTANAWRLLTSFYTSPGFSNEHITLFLASDLRTDGRPSACEIVEQDVFRVDRLAEMVFSSEIVDAKTILAIYWLVAHAGAGPD